MSGATLSKSTQQIKEWAYFPSPILYPTFSFTITTLPFISPFPPSLFPAFPSHPFPVAIVSASPLVISR